MGGAIPSAANGTIEVADSDEDVPPERRTLQQAQNMELDATGIEAANGQPAATPVALSASDWSMAALPRAPLAMQAKVEPRSAEPHSKCMSGEDCVGRPEDHLVLHVLEGLPGDTYCESCWRGFLSENPTFEGRWEDGPNAGKAYCRNTV